LGIATQWLAEAISAGGPGRKPQFCRMPDTAQVDWFCTVVQNARLVELGRMMDPNFLKAQIERCRSLADHADTFTRRRLLDLAEKYESRLAKPSVATRALKMPINLSDAPEQP
jgi:hypothetical protein